MPVRGHSASITGSISGSISGSQAGDEPTPQKPTASSNNLNGEGMINALKKVKGSSAISVENVSNIENYGSNLVLDLINKGMLEGVQTAKDNSSPTQADESSDLGSNPSQRFGAEEGGISEQQMIMMVLSQNDGDLADVIAAASESNLGADQRTQSQRSAYLTNSHHR